MRILVGQLNTESHWFSKRNTNRSDFQIAEGEEMVSAAFSPGFGLCGILSAARDDNIKVVPSLAARALPGGPVEDNLYFEFRSKFITAIQKTNVDGICLDLHGAMRSVSVSDVEGDLLAAIRQNQPDIPISVVLDMHGIPTPDICYNADIIVGYKTNPHTDTEACGAKSLRALVDMITNSRRPVRTAIRLPFLLTANDASASGPLSEAHRAARIAENKIGQLVDLSIFNSHHFADDPAMGQVLVATTWEDPCRQTIDTMTEIGNALWEQRALFRGSYASVSEVLSRARDENHPFALGDSGDRTLAGTPGDTTGILEMLSERHQGFRSFVPVYDPIAAQKCWENENCSPASLPVGGGITPGMRPVSISGTVIRRFDGKYIGAGPYGKGISYDMGPSVVVRCGEIDVFITSKPPATHDKAFFQRCDLDLNDYRVVVFKSGMHFIANFDDVLTCVVVETNGLSSFNLENYPYLASRPIYPLDEINEIEILPKIWRRPTTEGL
ncbi:M81 family metallopeptidase [Mesorhizobium sp.]|uniref:M81 family metallopeptidase n=1 Tax=Mesorhizobium sp. TaxID=1871066 RepID=UPI0025D06811|nr:M81 family metallopeptidase [Mesorhizobium sp.]